MGGALASSGVKSREAVPVGSEYGTLGFCLDARTRPPTLPGDLTPALAGCRPLGGVGVRVVLKLELLLLELPALGRPLRGRGEKVHLQFLKLFFVGFSTTLPRQTVTALSPPDQES